MSVQDIDLLNQTFLKSLSNFEKSLFSLASNSSGVDFLELLGVDVVIPEAEGNGVVIPAPKSDLSLFDFQKICSVLCAYRFFDLISLRAVSRVSASPPIPMFLPGSPGPKDDLHVSMQHLLFFIF